MEKTLRRLQWPETGGKLSRITMPSLPGAAKERCQVHVTTGPPGPRAFGSAVHSAQHFQAYEEQLLFPRLNYIYRSRLSTLVRSTLLFLFSNLGFVEI